MQALAARRGWALTVTGDRLGRAGTLRLTPRGGLPWVAETRFHSGAYGGPFTEYEADAPRWAEGTLIVIAGHYGDAPDPQSGQPAHQEVVLREALGEAATQLAAGLHPLSAPGGILALSDRDPSLRVDLAAVARAFEKGEASGLGSGPRPVMILSPQGIRLRVHRPVKRPDQMERFLDLALELARIIGP